jgi:hypothetical protein
MAAPARAQGTAAALADSTRALEARLQVARATFDSVVGRWRRDGGDSTVVAGVTLRYAGAELPEADLRRIRRGFETVVAELRQSLGPSGESLLAGTSWQVSARYFGSRGGPIIAIEPDTGPRMRASRPTLSSPVSAELVAALIRQWVGDRLRERHPALAGWVTTGLTVPADDRLLAMALRDLNLSGSARALRCARGSREDCVVILDPARRREWRDAGDDSVRIGPPASDAVRASLVTVAIARGGAQFLPALAAADTSEAQPLTVLAAAAGVPPDTLLHEWRETLRAVGARDAALPPRLVLSTAAWALFLAWAATRRRAA